MNDECRNQAFFFNFYLGLFGFVQVLLAQGTLGVLLVIMLMGGVVEATVTCLGWAQVGRTRRTRNTHTLHHQYTRARAVETEHNRFSQVNHAREKLRRA